MKEFHLYYWSALTVASVVSLTSLLTIVGGPSSWDGNEWVISATVVSLLMSGFGYTAHVLIHDKFAGTRFEGFMVRPTEMDQQSSYSLFILCKLTSI